MFQVLGIDRVGAHDLRHEKIGRGGIKHGGEDSHGCADPELDFRQAVFGQQERGLPGDIISGKILNEVDV